MPAERAVPVVGHDVADGVQSDRRKALMAHRRGHRPILVCGVASVTGPAAPVACRDSPTGRCPGRPRIDTALPRRQGSDGGWAVEIG